MTLPVIVSQLSGSQRWGRRVGGDVGALRAEKQEPRAGGNGQRTYRESGVRLLVELHLRCSPLRWIPVTSDCKTATRVLAPRLPIDQ